MSAAITFAYLKTDILKRLDLAFPDRASQFQQLKAKLSKANENEINETDKDRLENQIKLLDRLTRIQNITKAPYLTTDVSLLLAESASAFGAYSDKDSDEDIHSIKIHILCYLSILLTYVVQTSIFKYAGELEHAIHFWSARKAKKWSWWFFVEKTPYYWLRYFDLLPEKLSGPAIVHPRTEVMVKITVLKRLRLALRWWLGGAEYMLANCQLEDPSDCADLTVRIIQHFKTFDQMVQRSKQVDGLTLKSTSFSGGCLVSQDPSAQNITIARLAQITIAQLQGKPQDSQSFDDINTKKRLQSLARMERKPTQALLAEYQNTNQANNIPAQANESKDGSSTPTQLDPKWMADMKDTSFCRDEIMRTCHDIDRLMKSTQRQIVKHGPPPFYERNWLLCVGVATVSFFGLRNVCSNWGLYEKAFSATKNALRRFFLDYAVQPMQRIYQIIRYNNSQVSVMTKQSLDEDVESLVRMVSDFNIDKLGSSLDPTVLTMLEEQARAGNIGSIMAAYEKEIPHPIANALVGDLLRLALIQIQKQKVDVERAMVQLDQLLKQNEINFQMFATLPSVLILILLFRIITRKRDPYKNTHETLRGILRKIAILINKTSTDVPSLLPIEASISPVPAAMSYEDFGNLLILLNDLQSQAILLPVQERIGFLDDIKELGLEYFTAKQRLSTIQRMYNNYKFLVGGVSE